MLGLTRLSKYINLFTSRYCGLFAEYAMAIKYYADLISFHSHRDITRD